MREQTIIWRKRPPKKEGRYLCNMKADYFTVLEWCDGGWNVQRMRDGTINHKHEIAKSHIKEWAEIERE